MACSAGLLSWSPTSSCPPHSSHLFLSTSFQPPHYALLIPPYVLHSPHSTLLIPSSSIHPTHSTFLIPLTTFARTHSTSQRSSLWHLFPLTSSHLPLSIYIFRLPPPHRLSPQVAHSIYFSPWLRRGSSLICLLQRLFCFTLFGYFLFEFLLFKT